MRNANNNKPTLAWTLLVALISQGGTVTIRDPKRKAQVEKQKQTLATKLRATFGIEQDPVRWDSSQKAYVACFLVRDQRPLAERDPGRHPRR